MAELGLAIKAWGTVRPAQNYWAVAIVQVVVTASPCTRNMPSGSRAKLSVVGMEGGVLQDTKEGVDARGNHIIGGLTAFG
jgi:hypothetical protein